MTGPDLPAPLRVLVPVAELLLEVRNAVERGRSTGNLSEAVGRLFDFLGPYTTAEVRAASELDAEHSVSVESLRATTHDRM